MKKLCAICLGLLFSTFSVLSISADINSNLAMAKQYEGNFYQYHTSGDWYIFSEEGVSLGEAIPLQEDIHISYYINKDEDYVIQYYKDDNNMSYAIWRNDTIEFLSCSKY